MMWIRRITTLGQKTSHITLFLGRTLHSESTQVRVRFAPSPTGKLHLGGLRTALYNYLFARAQNGAFILRIEDTDQTRKVPGATELLQETLNWAGIKPDEGPQIGGDRGPYIQSERISIYKQHATDLIKTGRAYHCFCSYQKQDLLRRERLRAQGMAPASSDDHECPNLTEDQIRERLEKGLSNCVRFKLTEGEHTFEDLIYGPITLNSAALEGDMVIVKTDGFPTYHLASVIDDHLMNISHVIRGNEWQMSTTKHQMLYEAFGWKAPEFAHLPLIVNKDGSKLSKRDGHVDVEYYRDAGYAAKSIINFIANTGGGIQKELDALMDLQELASNFQISRVRRSSSQLEIEKLNELNRRNLNEQLQSPSAQSKIVETIRQKVQENFGDKITDDMKLMLSSDKIMGVLDWASKGYIICRVNELWSPEKSYLWILPSGEIPNKLDTRILQAVKEILSEYPEEDFKRATLVERLRKESKELHVKFNVLMASLRSMLYGIKEGPGVAELMEVQGKFITMARFENGLLKLENKRKTA